MKRLLYTFATLMVAGTWGCLILCPAHTSTAQATETQKSSRGVSSKAASLLQAFKAAKYPWIQAEISEKLVALHDRSVVPALLGMLHSPDRAQRCNAGRVLASLGEERGFFAVLAEFNDTKPRPSRDGQQQEPNSQRQLRQDRYYAAAVLREIGDKRAVPVLIDALQDPSLDYQAAIVLGHLGDQRAVPALLAVLKATHASPQLSRSQLNMGFWTGYGLMWLRHPKGLPAVAHYLKPQSPLLLRRYAADALGEFKAHKAVPFLLAALKDEDVEVQVNALMALGRIGDPAAVPALQVALTNPNPVQGRAHIRYHGSLPLFQAMTVREAAASALAQIQSQMATS